MHDLCVIDVLIVCFVGVFFDKDLETKEQQ